MTPSSVSLLTTVSYCSAVNEGGAKRMSTLKIFLSLRGESLTLLSSQGENVCAHGPSLKGLETHHSFPQILCLHAAVGDEAGGDEVSKDSAVAGVSTLVEAGRQVGARGA